MTMEKTVTETIPQVYYHYIANLLLITSVLLIQTAKFIAIYIGGDSIAQVLLTKNC